MSIRNRFVVSTLLLLTGIAPALAQSDRGAVVGSVTDPSGAVVPGARVTAKNVETSELREASTTAEGNYTLSELKAGLYLVAVEAQGFKKAMVEDVRVGVQFTRTVDVKLEVGAIGDVVTVRGDTAPVIQTQTAVRQTNVTGRQMKELPLLVGSEFSGRVPLSLVFLDSNVSTGRDFGRGTNIRNFRVGGGQAFGTEVLIDGASARSHFFDDISLEGAPGPNAFREFTISTATYSAEFGHASGGVVNFTQRGGSNEFHGEVYDLIRNEKLNANSYRNNAAGRFGPNDPEVRAGAALAGQERLPRVRDNQNDFGFSLSGPVTLFHFGEGGPRLNRLDNRAFFFLNYEGYRFTEGDNAVITVPTLKMRVGDFSELLTDPYVLQYFGRPVQIYDPRQPSATRAAIPGNRLDLYQNGATIDRAGLAILQYFPAPNTTGPGGSTVFHNYISRGVRPTRMNQYTAKIDVVVSDRQQLTGSYSWRRNDSLQGNGLTDFPVRFPPPFTNANVFQRLSTSHFVRLQHDYTFTPTLLNHFNLGFTRYDVANRNTTDPFNTASLGIPVGATQNSAFPRILFPGYGDPVTSPDPRAYEDIGSSFFTDHFLETNWHLSDAVSWVRGRHSLKFGAEVRPSQLNFRVRIHPGGQFDFFHGTTAATRDRDGGWPIASLITGAVTAPFRANTPVDPQFRQLTQGYYAQDDIRVTSRLTLNVGLRYDIPGPRYEARDFYRGFDPTQRNPEVGRLGAIAGAAGQGGVRARYRSLVKTDYSNWGPRLGGAYSLDERTVVRGGIGIYYAPIVGGTDEGLQGYRAFTSLEFLTPTEAGGFLSSFPSLPPITPNSQFIGSDVNYFDPDFKTGRTVQWSLDVQRQLPFNLVASAGYVGHKATRLRSNLQRLNAMPLNALRLGYPVLSMSLSSALADPNVVSYAQSVGVTLPSSSNAVYSGFAGTVAQALKPFPQYNNINSLAESQGTSDYHALQVKLDRRLTRGVQFGASYTFSKLFTDASDNVSIGSSFNLGLGDLLQNPFDRTSLRTVSPDHSPHVFVVNYVIELPFGKGHRFLNGSGFAGKLLGGWQVAGIQRYEAGRPLPVYTSDPNNTEFLFNLAGYSSYMLLNPTGQPFTTRGDFQNCPRCGRQVINPAAFTTPPLFGSQFNRNPSGAAVGSAAYRNYYANPLAFFGTLPPVLSNVTSEPYRSEDVSLLKKTRISETVVFELGAEAFNLFNRTRYFFPSTDFRDQFNFGFQSIGAETPRRVQIRLRLLF